MGVWKVWKSLFGEVNYKHKDKTPCRTGQEHKL